MQPIESSLFPELEQLEKENLIIVGNGFDIAHGIKSRYSDFRKWLGSQKHVNLIRLMDIFFSNQRDVWSDLEVALGEYDEKSILSFCRPDEEFDLDHSLSSATRIEDSPMAIFQPMLRDFKEYFKEWVSSIEIEGIEKFIPLSTQCKYLSFNYTDTLESVYKIPADNIVHIHGSRLLKDEFVIGHNKYRNPSDVWSNESIIFESQAMENIINWMNDFVKDYKGNIGKYHTFFAQLASIKQVVVYGHSMNEIDWPYFEEIINFSGNDIPWRVSYFSVTDINNINKFQSKYKLTKLSKFSINDNK